MSSTTPISDLPPLPEPARTWQEQYYAEEVQFSTNQMRAYALLVRQQERERCALICDRLGESEYPRGPDDCAAAIRGKP